MFEEIDLKISEDLTTKSEFIFTISACGGCTTTTRTRTASGGYGTSCKYCC